MRDCEKSQSNKGFAQGNYVKIFTGISRTDRPLPSFFLSLTQRMSASLFHEKQMKLTALFATAALALASTAHADSSLDRLAYNLGAYLSKNKYVENFLQSILSNWSRMKNVPPGVYTQTACFTLTITVSSSITTMTLTPTPTTPTEPPPYIVTVICSGTTTLTSTAGQPFTTPPNFDPNCPSKVVTVTPPTPNLLTIWILTARPPL
ncbi:uncharacterized protein VTP21DRAFT_6930 [Calcarisporiella thermophila]|uniref:uncharacterized protein n=1 Tax=Calcarisporiella thermophila TaxID=911321 RepID=UPI003742B58D